jgi:hypothetical protein
MTNAEIIELHFEIPDERMRKAMKDEKQLENE